MRGTFIVIDGNDGSGKATQTKMLVERLKKESYKVLDVTFPDDKNNFFGKFIRECLNNEEYKWRDLHPKIASIVYAADRWESSALIKAHLEAGFIVISDRYVSANQIHQGGKITDDDKRDDFMSWLDTLEYKTFKIPEPDIVVYLNVPMSVSEELLRRRYSSGGHMDEHEKSPEFLRNSKITGDWLAESEKNWVEVKCTENGEMRCPADIHDDIYQKIREYRIF